ncbi:LysR family transcriptional regulator [Clostridium sp. AN503]|uniref:LysR family transcriptional regulator n=1 Tax=Clostridium sp. AN503 TaxID=3160598 RepID=UPI00345AB5A8
MDLHALSQFKKIAELQHITRAAEELHVAQPSLSRTIARLEQELGVPLFERSGKNIILNDYGKIVLKHTDQIFQEIKDIERELEEASDEKSQTVSLSLYSASKLLPGLVMAFKKAHPAVRLQIIQENLHKDPSKECDLTLYSSMQPSDSEYSVTLFAEDIFLALPESNPLAHRSSLQLSEVAHEEFICLQRGKSLRTITDTYCRIAGFEPSVVLESDSPETVRELIRAGIGISFIPSITWQGMETENLVLIPIESPQCKRYINLSWRSRGYFSPAAGLFRDFVQEYFKPYKKE